MASNQSNEPWHMLGAEEILEELESSGDGLSPEEAHRRLKEYGPNSIKEEKEVSALEVAVAQFTSPLIYVLVAALIATLALQRWSDAIVIGLVLAVNGVVGFLQEYRAQSAIHELMEMVSPKADVRRGGEETKVDSNEIVPGDIVLLSEGNVVPADLRLIESKSLQINEAALTGESVPASKRIDRMEDADKDLPPADIENMAYMGTAVTSGSGIGVTIATGAKTEVGQIAESIRSAETQKTPIQRRMDRFAKALAIGILLVAAVAFGIGLAMGNSVQDMFLLAVALAVAAMPAGLPVVMTVALAVGVRRMARRQAVIRHLPAVETLGSCTVIVSDKTGTLTQNRMAVREIAAGDHRYSVAGDALSATGKFERDEKEIDPAENEALRLTLLVGVLNSEADVQLRQDSSGDDGVDDLEVSGDPLEVALLVAGFKADMRREELLQQHMTIDDIPFKTERRFAASVHKDAEGDGPLVCIKGAPEVILEMSDDRLVDSEAGEIDRSAIGETMDDMASSGLRLLGMAIGHGEDAAERIHDEEPSGFSFAGVQGLLDPPRDSARKAVDDCHAAGIRVIMVTGDHARTAAAIGHKVHLNRPVRSGIVNGGEGESEDSGLPETFAGREVDDLTEEEFDEILQRVNVFARFKPEQKLKLVRRLRDNGHIVAVTGDGVNDAPALKEADLGVAMGETGTDVAKEASDMVITDDNFASVYGAVEEGRTAFRNIRMATFFLLSTGAADVLIILVGLLAGWPLPLLPAQILWCNVVTNGIADVALGFEPGRRSLFQRPPRPPEEGLLHRPLLVRLAIIGVWLTVGTLGVFYWVNFVRDDGIDKARVAALTTLVLFQQVHVFNCRSEDQSIFRTSLLSNKVLFIGVVVSLAVHIVALYVPWTQQLLSLQPLDATTWLVIICIAATAIIPNELHKLLLRHRRTS